MSNDQEQKLRILDNALWRIAHRGECEYYDASQRPKPCDCPICVAKAALDQAEEWRFHGALYDRVRYQSESWPREVKMHAAWVKKMTGGQPDPDHLLKQILSDGRTPDARDWYVATSVIQWLATSVGMTVLQQAGFEYQQWEQDRRRDEKPVASEVKPEGKP